MKTFLTFILLSATLTVFSQTSVYKPFPEDSATWVSDYFSNSCSGYCGTDYYEMKGDTIINGQSYNKIYYRSGSFYTTFTTCSYKGAIRQDSINKKVYYNSAST